MQKTKATLAVAAGAALMTAFMLNGETKMAHGDLTQEEQNVILDGGTEPPYTGVYVDTFDGGIYTCRRCGSALYTSDAKFDSHCGWPSFDTEIQGAVTRRVDADGVRTEILCSSCGAHLGHVFSGEGYTETDTRHCVNSVSMVFIPEERIQKAYFAAGCFWGVEYSFDHTDGVLSARSGYMGSDFTDPKYADVCSGSTGHAETVEVVFDRSAVSFRELAMMFFEMHDPEQVNRQGVDTGTQYRSAVFYTSEQQLSVINELVSVLENGGYSIATEVSPAGNFWQAENYHQNYYDKNGVGSSCHVRVNRFTRE
ncbi:MAG: bifunctional methionine sulfoxide reductase B/A protein [Candidatus Fermentibacteraceae bacterium]|nr:bifunctional methionine sulfoxide reductase B/A protein [Candidatus Fermentibacteraceae bacterium]